METYRSCACGPLIVTILPAGFDNYVYVVQWDGGSAVVDPGEADPVLAHCRACGLHPETILLTHGHRDHVAGAPALKKAFGCRVVGPALGGVDRAVGEGDTVEVGPTRFRVLATPGHTAEHISFYADEPGVLFCGDVLFVAGCGRIMGSDAGTLWRSLCKLAALPASTLVFCGHEYTEENLRFALTIEPDNPDVPAWLTEVRDLLAAKRPTVPSTISRELKTNVFLRAGDQAEFGERRRAKDRFG